MSQPKFDRPEQDEYIDWLDSLPDCTTCEGCGWVHGEFDGEERTCRACNGSGKIFPEEEEAEEHG